VAFAVGNENPARSLDQNVGRNLVSRRLFALQFKVQATKGIADGATRGLRFGCVLRARIRRSGR
jgi:hypothetical protein